MVWLSTVLKQSENRTYSATARLPSSSPTVTMSMPPHPPLASIFDKRCELEALVNTPEYLVLLSYHARQEVLRITSLMPV